MRTATLLVAILACGPGLAPPAHAQSDPLIEAKEHYRRGTQLYDLGRYLDAASEYERAFQLSDRAPFLFNIGQAYRLGGRPKEAIAAYEGFLRRVPDDPQRPDIEAMIVELSKAAATTKPSSTTPEPQTTTTTTATHNDALIATRAAVPVYKKWWLWTVVGVVAAGVVVGVAVGVTESGRTRGTEFDRVTAP